MTPTAYSFVLVDLTTDKTPANLRPGPMLAALAQALQEQVSGPFAAAYGARPVSFAICPNGDADRQPGDIAVHFRDEIPEAPEAVAYHTVTGGVPDVEVGCAMFDSLGDPGDSLSQGVSHELLELLADPGADLWQNMGGGVMRPEEVCDTVQNTGYKSGNGLWMSNFLLPAAWVPGAPGPWDHLSVMKGQDDYSNGYEIHAPFPSDTTQVGGIQGQAIVGSLTDLQRKRKSHPFSRTYRRGGRFR